MYPHLPCTNKKASTFPQHNINRFSLHSLDSRDEMSTFSESKVSIYGVPMM